MESPIQRGATAWPVLQVVRTLGPKGNAALKARNPALVAHCLTDSTNYSGRFLGFRSGKKEEEVSNAFACAVDCVSTGKMKCHRTGGGFGKRVSLDRRSPGRAAGIEGQCSPKEERT